MMFKPVMAGVQVVKYGSSSHSLPLITTSVENFYHLGGKRFRFDGKNAGFTGKMRGNNWWEIVGVIEWSIQWFTGRQPLWSRPNLIVGLGPAMREHL
jgi:hypothetical protein